MIDLSNKIAVITGAGIGIGKGIATILANQGASIAIPDINLKDATQTINEIQSNGNEGIAIEMDVTNEYYHEGTGEAYNVNIKIDLIDYNIQ